jgi:general stress protein 26
MDRKSERKGMMANTPDMNAQRKTFFSLLDKFDVAMLVTHGESGMLHARPMMIAERQDNGDLLFMTRTDAQKADEVREDERMVATLQQPGKYISVAGKGRLERDPLRIQRLWRERWRAWFPGGPSDPNLILVRLSATEGDYWDFSGARAIKHAFRTARAVLQPGRRIAPTDYHGHVSLHP